MELSGWQRFKFKVESDVKRIETIDFFYERCLKCTVLTYYHFIVSLAVRDLCSINTNIDYEMIRMGIRDFIDTRSEKTLLDSALIKYGQLPIIRVGPHYYRSVGLDDIERIIEDTVLSIREKLPHFDGNEMAWMMGFLDAAASVMEKKLDSEYRDIPLEIKKIGN